MNHPMKNSIVRIFVKSVFLIFFLFNHCISFSKEATLTIHIGSQLKTYSQSELLKHSKVELIEVESDPAYEKKIKYKAIKVSELFKGLKIDEDAVIQFKALDGFAAPISKERILNTSQKQSIAYIAVEDPQNKWPILPKHKSSAGPFYLVWKNPELSKISNEEWPFMLASFEVKGTLESLYPNIFPSTYAQKNHDATLGFMLFTKNCFSCHTINKQGASSFGPDLNLPMNPTEYLNEDALKKLIRDPQSVRHWPLSRMNGFSKNAISDKELNQLISYLKNMASLKTK